MSQPRDIQAILQRQAAFWEMKRRLRHEGGEAARSALAHLAEGPWITLSRQFGSGGNELARNLSAELGWQVFDKEIVSAIAEQTDSRESVLADLDQHALGAFNDYINQLIVPRNPGQVAYLQELVRVVWGLGKQGNALILGRGANWLLKAEFGLRVRVVAPLALRVRRIAEREGLSDEDAEKRAREHDSERGGFIRRAFGREIEDPLGYDLVLNTAELKTEAAAAAVLSALRSQLGL